MHAFGEPRGREKAIARGEGGMESLARAPGARPRRVLGRMQLAAGSSRDAGAKLVLISLSDSVPRHNGPGKAITLHTWALGQLGFAGGGPRTFK